MKGKFDKIAIATRGAARGGRGSTTSVRYNVGGGRTISTNGGQINLTGRGRVSRIPAGRRGGGMGTFGRMLPRWLQRILYGTR